MAPVPAAWCLVPAARTSKDVLALKNTPCSSRANTCLLLLTAGSKQLQQAAGNRHSIACPMYKTNTQVMCKIFHTHGAGTPLHILPTCRTLPTLAGQSFVPVCSCVAVSRLLLPMSRPPAHVTYTWGCGVTPVSGPCLGPCHPHC